MEILQKKQKRKFRKKHKIFCEKVAKINQKRLNFVNTRLIFKEGLSASSIDGLKQNINLDSRTTRKHQTIHRFACKYSL